MFTGHFAGDGHENGGGSLGSGTVYDYSFQGYANNVAVVAPLVGPWQLGFARSNGSGHIEVANGKFVGNPGSVYISNEPHSPRYLRGSLRARVIGFAAVDSNAGAVRKEYLDLKVQVTQSTYASRGLCPVGLVGHVILVDTDAILSNGKSASYVTAGPWFGKCPTFYMGFFNTDGGPRTNPQFGGPPGGGQWAVVQIKPTTSGSGYTWAGSWNTDYGAMNLTQSGNSVTGTFGNCNGTATISGQVSGFVLDGTWTQPCNSKTGRIHFVMNSDGRSFAGAWSYGNSTPTSSWNGTRT
jgi:hypothetical protein